MVERRMYGGKADSLIRLKKYGFNVPDFFVIDVDDYREFLEENNLIDKVRELLLNNNFKEVKSIILNGMISEKLKRKVSNEFIKLDCNLVSVRSSALNEDGENKSFAGQYNSYLNVTLDNLFESIKLCWISLYNDSVSEYSEKGDIWGMNVIIQKMVKADYAGVAFSIDPTSDTNNYSIVEIVEGLGENLVSGKVTPVRFLVRRETNHIDLKIGNIDIEDELISELVSIILNIEEKYNCHVDVEFAIMNNSIYILQTRPITAQKVAVKSYDLSITRPNSIIEEEIYYRVEYDGIKSITRGFYYFKPLFIYNKENDNVLIYYNCLDLEEEP